MLDKKELNKRILLALIASPVTLLPFAAGVTGLIITWVFSLGGVGLFFSLVFVLLAAGTLLTRLATGSLSEISKKALAEIQEEIKQRHDKYLDELYQRLLDDDDPRTDTALADLRTLMESFQQHDWADSKSFNTQSTLDILAGIEELFNGCVSSLEKTLELYYAAKKLRTPSARKPLMERRETIIKEVNASVSQLGQILAQVQQLGVDDDNAAQLSRLRQDLNENLEIARRVGERMRGMMGNNNSTLEK
jgi:hypothetical protein